MDRGKNSRNFKAEKIILDFYINLKTAGNSEIPLEKSIILLNNLFKNHFYVKDYYSASIHDGSQISPIIFSDVFENLYLKNNKLSKKTGSYYTPSKIANQITENVVNLSQKIDNSQLFSKKILDPSCGAGEFLLAGANSLLQRIKSGNDFPKELLERMQNKNGERDEIKKDNTLLRYFIVKNCIYGRDIEPVAVFISKLRLFLWVYENYDWDLDPQNFTKELGEKLDKFDSDLKNNIITINFLQSYGESNQLDYYWNKKFEIIIGNPPFNVEIPQKTIKRVKKQIKGVVKNSAAYMLVLSRYLVKERGLIGFIMPKSLAYSKGWERVKNLIVPDLLYVKDISKAFVGVKLEQIIIISSNNLKNSEDIDKFRAYYICEHNSDELNGTKKLGKIFDGNNNYERYWVLKQLCSHNSGDDRSYDSGQDNGQDCSQDDNKYPLILGLSSREYSFFKNLTNMIPNKLGNFIKAHRGYNIQKQAIKYKNQIKNKRNSGNSDQLIVCFGGKEIKKFGLEHARRCIERKKVVNYLDIENQSKSDNHNIRIIGQLANAHVKNPKPHYKLAFFPILSAESINFLTFDTVINIFLKDVYGDDEENLFLYYLLSFFNSRIFAWYLYKVTYSGAIRSTRLDEIYLKNIPCIFLDKNNQDECKILILMGLLARSLILLTQFKIYAEILQSKNQNKKAENFDGESETEYRKEYEVNEEYFTYFEEINNDIFNLLYIDKTEFIKKMERESPAEKQFPEKLINDQIIRWDRDYGDILLSKIPKNVLLINDYKNWDNIIQDYKIWIQNTYEIVKKIFDRKEFSGIRENLKNSSDYDFLM